MRKHIIIDKGVDLPPDTVLPNLGDVVNVLAGRMPDPSYEADSAQEMEEHIVSCAH